MAQLLAVAKTEREAEDIARRGAQWMVGSYMNPTKAAGATARLTAQRCGGQPQPVDPIERYLDGVAIYGTPERVFDEIQRRRELMSLDYLLCAPLSHSSFVMFTDQVLPRLL